MASEQQIAEGIAAVFQETNPNSFTSLNDLLICLQSKLGGLDLSNKLDFIQAHLTFLFTQPQPSHFSNPPNPTNPTNPNSRVYNYPTPPPTSHSHFHAALGGPRGPTEISFARSALSDAHSSAPPSKDSTQTRPKRRGGAGGLNKLCGVSPLLQTIVGQPEMPRTEIVKQLWVYIRKHNLQDPSNKRKIICNDELRLVFETDCTDMFQMNKLLAKHIVPLDTKDSGQQSKKMKVEDFPVPTNEPKPSPASVPTTATTPVPPPASVPATAAAPVPPPPSDAAAASPASNASAAAPASVSSRTSTPIVISDALAKFFGTCEKEMLQSEVFKRIEQYIEVNGLEDRLNSMILCDSKLQELFACESIPKPGIHDVLARDHLFQRP